MKQEQTIPPSVIEFKNDEGKINQQNPNAIYKEWVESNLAEESTVWTIEVNGQRFSVGNKVKSPEFPTYEFPITSFIYITNRWFAFLANGACSDAVDKLTKLPSSPIESNEGGEELAGETLPSDWNEYSAADKLRYHFDGILISQPPLKESGKERETIDNLVIERDNLREALRELVEELEDEDKFGKRRDAGMLRYKIVAKAKAALSIKGGTK